MTQHDDDQPQFARVTNGQETKELRGDCPRWILNVLDAVSMAEDRTRNSLVIDILGDYAKKKLHESSLIQRLSRGNPQPAEPSTGSR